MSLAVLQSLVNPEDFSKRPFSDSLTIKEIVDGKVLQRCVECVKKKPNHSMYATKGNVKRHWKSVHKTLLTEETVAAGNCVSICS